MSIKLFSYHKLAGIMPETRGYRFKAILLRNCGYKVDLSARIVSSAKFIGSFDLSVGEDTFIGHEVLIAGGQCTITIGNHCDLAPRVGIIAGTHEIDMMGPHSAGPGYSKDIVIEDGVWIGTGVTVLGGVHIGKKSVIAAGSVVASDIPPNSIATGTPCRVIKTWHTHEQRWVPVRDRQE